MAEEITVQELREIVEKGYLDDLIEEDIDKEVETMLNKSAKKYYFGGQRL